MKQLRSHLLLTAALGCLTSCLSKPFGYSIDLEGGWDQQDEEDLLYFSAERVAGLASEGNALVIPSGWHDRSVREIAPGVLELTEPLEFRWIAGGADILATRPEMEMGEENQGRWLADRDVWVRVQARAHEIGMDWQPTCPELDYSDYGEVSERLAAGQDAYVLVPHRRYLKHGFDVFAAAGPPLFWVRLGEVRVESGEGRFAWFLGRTVGALAYGVEGVAVVSAHVLGFAMAMQGGMVIFDTPFMDHMPESPW